MFVIDNTDRIMFQFNFTNERFVPLTVERFKPETKADHVARKAPQGKRSGTMVIAPTENCSLKELLPGVELAGFEMVAASYQERIDAKDSGGGRRYHTVRFVFARSEDAEISNELWSLRDILRSELQEMCDDAMWRVRVYSNPFFKNGEEISGRRALSFNFEARVPLYRPNGEPVAVWQKDEDGARVGDAPVPISAGHHLRFEGNAVQLVSA